MIFKVQFFPSESITVKAMVPIGKKKVPVTHVFDSDPRNKEAWDAELPELFKKVDKVRKMAQNHTSLDGGE